MWIKKTMSSRKKKYEKIKKELKYNVMRILNMVSSRKKLKKLEK